MNEQKSGAELIDDERARQVEEEAFPDWHDDLHTRAELTNAASCYLAVGQAQTMNVPHGAHPGVLQLWPWDEDDFKPSDDPIRNLVKAGALIAAEIDRLQRLKKAS